MLPQRNRLRGRLDVALVRREGRMYRHPLALMVVRPNELDSSRFGFSASRRVGQAVVRNRARRRLREIVRRRLTQLAPGSDCLFIARQATAVAPASELEAAVELLLRRSNLWLLD